MTGPLCCDEPSTTVDPGERVDTTPADDGTSFCPVTVADDLDDLRGPTRGRQRLPRDLEPAAGTHYDLADRWARRRLTITVLTAAPTTEELHTWIDRDTLLAAWPTLYLDGHVRTAWETRHPGLAEQSTSVASN